MKYTDVLKRINYWGDLKIKPGKTRKQYLDILLEQSNNRNISAVTGVRRAGKSTILMQVLHSLIKYKNVKPENTLYVNFEDPRLNELLVDNNLFDLIKEFNKIADNRSKVYVVFDEIQNVQNWESILRTIYDQESNLKIYITGSSAKLLGKELGTKLAGRYISTEIFPLSFNEFKKFSNNTSVKDFIRLGGFPDVVLTNNENVRSQLLKDYYDSILLRDISLRYNIRNEFKLRRLASRLFMNISNQASSYKLSKDLDLSADTILQYFDYIEDAYLGFFISKYSDSIRKQEYNPKKFYSIDAALQKAISFKVIDDFGKLFENIVFLELRKKYKQIFYWEESKEVDFIVKDGEVTQLIINACFKIDNEQTKLRELNSLKEAMHKFNKKEAYIVIAEGKNENFGTEVGTIKVINFNDLDMIL